MQTLRVRSGEVALAVQCRGEASRTPIVLVHGFPDNHGVWAPVARQLAERYYVISYDVRGAGDSDAPSRTADYRIERLAEDLRAVADIACPGRKFHLVAHDWGSIQSWEAVTDPDFQDRIASYTTISGPCLDHVGYWMRRRLLRPTLRHLRELFGQLLHSWYIYLFHLPWLMPLLWRHVIAPRWPAVLMRLEGLASEPSATRAKDGYHAIKLYRANMLPRLFRPRRRPTRVPVQVIVPQQDKHVRPQLADELPHWAARLWRRDVEAGHWSLLLVQPEVLAGYVAEFVDCVESGQEAPALARARVENLYSSRHSGASRYPVP
ncbi:MAG TPA: alpha/beta fold hydrolase [Nevskiales bacterium]|nr:alpha/beta fold hydrolase [Nevskiales bacterium]